ncbi:hypothetical protein DM02DRAFT_628996 [Periconia macrospinosa]|uniref:RING-type domain-containing protein n=1 Tax=Periconia macrospinosa TaxID=97972 RepID=A0A2V1DP08_9PLEO|nr:hypothetical protein DM02DRAFT_628996 [Periconia macrospinosa]
MDPQPRPRNKSILELSFVHYQKEVHSMETRGQPIVEPVRDISSETDEVHCSICLEPWDNADPPKPSKKYTPNYDLAVEKTEVLNDFKVWDTRATKIARIFPIHFRVTRSYLMETQNRLTTHYAEASDVNEASIVKIVACNHVFHHSCLRSWVKKHQACPLCRITLRKIPVINGESTTNQAVLQNGTSEIPIESDFQQRRTTLLTYWARNGSSRILRMS